MSSYVVFLWVPRESHALGNRFASLVPDRVVLGCRDEFRPSPRLEVMRHHGKIAGAFWQVLALAA
jgi:hypothetical protein